MPSNLSAAAKSKVAAAAAVALAGVTAWQIATRGGFSWWDLIPVIAAVAGTACVDHVENTINRPAAKAVVHGALSAVAAVSAALAALVGPEPTGVSLTKLLVTGAGAFLVWYVPEAAPAVKTIEGEVAAHAPLPQVLASVAADVALVVGDKAAGMGPDQKPTPAAAPVSTPRQVDGVPNSAWSLKPVAAGTTSAPITPAPAGPPTAPMAAVTPTTTPAVAPVPTA